MKKQIGFIVFIPFIRVKIPSFLVFKQLLSGNRLNFESVFVDKVIL